MKFILFFSSQDIVIVNQNSFKLVVRVETQNCRIHSIGPSDSNANPGMILNFNADENDIIDFTCEQNPITYSGNPINGKYHCVLRCG